MEKADILDLRGSRAERAESDGFAIIHAFLGVSSVLYSGIIKNVRG